MIVAQEKPKHAVQWGGVNNNKEHDMIPDNFLDGFDGINFKVQDFIEKVNQVFSEIKSLPNYGFLVRNRGRNRDIKKFIEELFPLQKYLIFQLNNGKPLESIKWINGSQKGDTLLNGIETIEITVAEHKNEWIVRENMNADKPRFCADGTYKMSGLTSSIPVVKSPVDRIKRYTEMVINAVKRKLDSYDKIDSLIIFLNQDGILLENEFGVIIDGVKNFIDPNKIGELYICSFQFQVIIVSKGALKQ